MSKKAIGNKRRLIRAVGASVLLGVGLVHAEDIKVSLSGAEEVPAVTTAATGSGKFTVGSDHSVTGSVKTTGVEGTAAHIHLAPVGQSGPVVIALTKGADGVWNVPADAKLSDEQYAGLKAGNLYVNVHSAEHKPGEIRGQLKP